MVKRITNRYVNIGSIIAFMLLIKVIAILIVIICAHIAEGKNCELFKKIFNTEFLDFIEGNNFLRDYFSIIVATGIVIAGLFLVVALLISRDSFNLDYKRNYYFNFRNWRLFSGSVTGKEKLNFHYHPKTTILVSLILLVLLRCFLLSIVALLLLNVIDYYFKKNILGFNIIHESILENKIVMGITAVLITLCAICLLWSIVCRVVNKVTIFQAITQQKRAIIETIVKYNKDNDEEAKENKQLGFRQLGFRNIQKGDQIFNRAGEDDSTKVLESILYCKDRYSIRKLPNNGNDYDAEVSSNCCSGYSNLKQKALNADIRSVLAPIEIFVSCLPTASDICFYALDKMPCTKFLFSNSTFVDENVQQEYNVI